MMGTTHALMGMLFAATSLVFFPDQVFIAALAGFTGGLFPDLDLAFKHRKTLHHPSLFSTLAFLSGAAVLFQPTELLVAAFYFSFSAALHCWLDIFGGGLETRPWKPSSDKGVYLHVKDRWLEPKRWIRWDGAPEDFILSALLGAACLLFYTGSLRQLILVTLGIAAVYMVLRKKIVDWAPERFL